MVTLNHLIRVEIQMWTRYSVECRSKQTQSITTWADHFLLWLLVIQELSGCSLVIWLIVVAQWLVPCKSYFFTLSKTVLRDGQRMPGNWCWNISMTIPEFLLFRSYSVTKKLLCCGVNWGFAISRLRKKWQNVQEMRIALQIPSIFLQRLQVNNRFPYFLVSIFNPLAPS